MKFSLVFKPAAVKDLQKLPRAVQKRVKQKLQFYLEQDNPLDYAVPLAGDGKAGQYRFRVGDYRVVFDKDGDRLIVLYVEHRREVYRRH
jgi:mRNA interferase RelE/StbE